MATFPIFYAGNLDYYNKLLSSDSVEFEMHEHFPKQTYRNRIEILGPNGRQKLVIPTVKKSSRRAIQDVEISYAEDWQKDHWKSLEAAYRRSAYFEFYEDRLRPFYQGEYEKLVDWNLAFHKEICSILQLEIQATFSESYIENPTDDFRSYDFQYQTSPSYMQVFSDRFEFLPNLSIIDAIFNLGPQTKEYI